MWGYTNESRSEVIKKPDHLKMLCQTDHLFNESTIFNQLGIMINYMYEESQVDSRIEKRY
jgi:hypothetical protein